MQYFRLNLCVSLAGQINFVVLRSISLLMGNLNSVTEMNRKPKGVFI